MSDNKVIIADDNVEFVNTVKIVLKDWQITSSFSPEELKKKLNDSYDCLLLDLVYNENKPDVLQGLDIIPYIKENYPHLLIIIMTNYNSIETAQRSMKLGAIDFFNKKNLNWLEWKQRLDNYCRYARLMKVILGNDIDELTYHYQLSKMENALKTSKGNKTIAANILNKTPDQLLYLIKKKVYKTHKRILSQYPLIRDKYKLSCK